MSEDMSFSVPDHEAYDVVLPGLRAVLRIVRSKSGGDDRDLAAALEMVTLLSDAMETDVVETPDEAGFLIGWGDAEKKRAAHPWVKELWAEHPELRGMIVPANFACGARDAPAYWSYCDYDNNKQTVYTDEKVLATVDRLTEATPSGITYKDVARAWWGEDWAVDDAVWIAMQLWRVLRQHPHRYEKVREKGGPNVWRRKVRRRSTSPASRTRKAA